MLFRVPWTASWWWIPRGNVLIFNEGMERLTGYTAEEIIDTGHLSNFYDIGTLPRKI